jgi:tripartite-type tricarboxylate transporter receptor subunit TctC
MERCAIRGTCNPPAPGGVILFAVIIRRFMACGASRIALSALTLFAVSAPCKALQTEQAPDFPVKPIRIIVASSPGTASDIFARSLGEDLGAFYGKRIIVENRPGAGGLIGNTHVSKASADGYTLGMIDVTRIITELMRDPPPYRALADIIGVTHVASITNVLAVTPKIVARTASDFVAHARSSPGDLNYASLGVGSASHLAGEIFNRALSIKAVHVPYRSLSDSFIEIALGRVHYAIYTLPAVLGPVREGRIHALAVMTPQRSPALPNVPSIAEAGLPEAQVDTWSGVVAPRGTPRRVVEQLHGDIVRGLRKASLRELFVRQGAESMPEGTPDGFSRMMQGEYLRYQALIREGGIKPD